MHSVTDKLPNASKRHHTLANLALMVFFILLRPQGVLQERPRHGVTPLPTPRLTFSIGDANYNAATTPIDGIQQVNYVVLSFMMQKNVIRGKAIQHGVSGHPTACLLCIRSFAMSYTFDPMVPPPDTPLCSVLERNHWRLVPSTAIMAVLQASTTAISDTLGLQPCDISARALTGQQCHGPPSLEGGLF
jgi:hypothetical protein